MLPCHHAPIFQCSNVSIPPRFHAPWLLNIRVLAPACFLLFMLPNFRTPGLPRFPTSKLQDVQTSTNPKPQAFTLLNFKNVTGCCMSKVFARALLESPLEQLHQPLKKKPNHRQDRSQKAGRHRRQVVKTTGRHS